MASGESTRFELVILESGATVEVRRVTAWEAFFLGMLPVELLDYLLEQRKAKEDADLLPSLRMDDAPTGPIDRTEDFRRLARQTVVGPLEVEALTQTDLVLIRDAAFGFNWVDLVPLLEHWQMPLLVRAAARCRQAPSQFLSKSLPDLALDLAAVLGGDYGR